MDSKRRLRCFMRLSQCCTSNDNSDLLIPLAFAGVVGAVGGAVPGTLVGLFVGVLLTRIRGGPNDSSE